MTKQIFNQAQVVQSKIKEIKGPIKLIEGCKIVSITVRKFDAEHCNYTDEVINYNIPRSQIKDIYLRALYSELESMKYKLEKMLNEELCVQNSAEVYA